MPFDATELSIRSLFSENLGGVKIERVEFEPEHVIHGTTATVSSTKRRQEEAAANGTPDAQAAKSRKRKRRDLVSDLEAPEAQLPQIWDQPLLRSGSCAVLVFVDKASADSAMKACKKAASQAKKQGRPAIRWNGGSSSGLERTLIADVG